MIRFAIQFAGLMLATLLPSAGVQATGSIDGVVVAAGSSSPVPRAKVTLATSNGRQVATSIATIDGRFSIPDIAPGTYRLAASKEGFIWNARGSQVTVASGKSTDVSLGMVPDAVIAGRVVDWDGLPVVGIQVQVLSYFQDDRGSRRVLLPLRSAQTNDLGEYRIYWIPPGSYFVRVDPGDLGTRIEETLLPQVDPSSKRTLPQFVLTYFPGAVDAASARSFNLHGGETISGADIRLVEMRKHRVSGIVSTSSSGLADLRLTPRNPASGISDYTTSANRTGVFEFDNVIPGSYILSADTINEARVAAFGRTQIDVGNADVQNLSVVLTPGFDLRVRLTIEGRSRRSDDPQMVVNLRPAIPSTPAPTMEKTGDDELTLHRFMPGDYSVAVLSLTNARGPNGAPMNGRLYLKSAQHGGADVLTSGLHIEGPPSGILEIAMADGAETLLGSVLDDEKQPVSGVTVVLVPEPQLRGRSDLYKVANTDTSGRFEMAGIPPGQYKVFSWEYVNGGIWQYPDFMEMYEDRGQLVRIDSGRRDPITVQLIHPSY